MPNVFLSPSDLSEYLFRIVDNGGASADRYTVAFSDGSYLAMSAAPTHPQGVSMCGEGLDPQILEEWVSSGEAVDLALGDLPRHLVQHILDRNNQGLSDFLADVEMKRPHAVAPSRKTAEQNDGTQTCLGKGIYFTDNAFFVRLDGDPSDDRGPFETAREAVLASLPEQYSLAGPEYQSTIDDLMRLAPSEEVAKQIAELEAKCDSERETKI